jgi:hypothetical protein
LKATKFVKGAGEMLGYPISISSKSASSGVGLRSLEVGQDGTNSTSFSPPWYNTILKMLPLNRHTIYFDIWKQTFYPKNMLEHDDKKHATRAHRRLTVGPKKKKREKRKN